MKSRSTSDFPSQKVFVRLGNDRTERITRIHAFCMANAEYRDVAEICKPELPPIEESPSDDGDDSVTENAYVYLIKSGRYYKIGRTVSLTRRERELAIQLPEPAETVHTIATDDAPGIKAYWHRRFSEKRRNGEWFELSPSDVKAFRRRKFM